MGRRLASSMIRHNHAALFLALVALLGLERVPCLIGWLPGTLTASAKAASPEERAAAPCHEAGMSSERGADPGPRKGCSHCSRGHEGLLSVSSAMGNALPPLAVVASAPLCIAHGVQRRGSLFSFRARAREPDTLARSSVRLL